MKRGSKFRRKRKRAELMDEAKQEGGEGYRSIPGTPGWLRGAWLVRGAHDS